MITASSSVAPYRTSFQRRPYRLLGQHGRQRWRGAGFRPHELLEAALASCVNVWLRMYADNHRLPLERVVTTGQLNRDRPGEPVFEYRIELEGPLTEEQRGKLMVIAQTCPVRKTLSGALSFSCFNASS